MPIIQEVLLLIIQAHLKSTMGGNKLLSLAKKKPRKYCHPLG